MLVLFSSLGVLASGLVQKPTWNVARIWAVLHIYHRSRSEAGLAGGEDHLQQETRVGGQL